MNRKHTIIPLLTILLLSNVLLLTPSVSAEGEGWLSGWYNRRQHYINENITPTGTISVTQGSATVTGSGTNFNYWSAGDKILLPDGNWYSINSIASATSLTISQNYPSASASGKTYGMMRCNYPIKIIGFYNQSILDITNLVSQTKTWTGSESWSSEQKELASDFIYRLQYLQLQRYSANPILSPSAGKWDSADLHNPIIIYHNNTWKMFYSGCSVFPVLRIGYAYSSDGLSWTKYSVDSPVISQSSSGWDSYAVGSGGVIDDEGTLRMYYHGCASSEVWDIGMAYSTDGGITWTKHGKVLSRGSSGQWDDYSIYCARVIKEGSTYKMWYVGRRASTTPRIGYATSSDGISWTKYSGNPVMIPTQNDWDNYVNELFDVIKIADKYVMFYEARASGTGQQFHIGMAYSYDGITWIKVDANPIFDPNPTLGTWDDYHALHPNLAWDEATKQFRMYYVGTDGTNFDEVAKIGLATLTVPNDVVEFGGKCNSDFSDIRFTSSDGSTKLDYWIEESNSSDYAIFWFKMDSISSASTNVMYVYYGNDAATSESDAEKMWLFYDGFDGSSLNTTKWVGDTAYASVSGGILTYNSATTADRIIYQNSTTYPKRQYNVAVRWKGKFMAPYAGAYSSVGLHSQGDDALSIQSRGESTPFKSLTAVKDGSITKPATGFTTDAFITFEVRWNSSAASYFAMDDECFNSPLTTNIPVDSMGVFVHDYGVSNKYVQVDWIIMRICVMPEPSNGEWGSEELASGCVSLELILTGASYKGTKTLLAGKQYYLFKQVCTLPDVSLVDYVQLTFEPDGKNVSIRATRVGDTWMYSEYVDPNNYITLNANACYDETDGVLKIFYFFVMINWNWDDTAETIDITAFFCSEIGNDTDTYQDIFGVENDLVFDSLAVDDYRVNPLQPLTFSGYLYYEGTSIIPPDGDYSVTLKLNGNMKGTDSMLTDGAFSIVANAESTVGLYTYAVEANYASSDLFNDVIVDRIVPTFTVDDNDVPLGTAVNFTVSFKYEYDNTDVSSYTYTILRNNTAFLTDYTSPTFDDTVTVENNATWQIYKLASATGNEYGITVLSEIPQLSIFWYSYEGGGGGGGGEIPPYMISKSFVLALIALGGIVILPFTLIIYSRRRKY